MKQTAVEWLVEDLGVYLPISITSVQSSIEQAKEMEKQQIMKNIHVLPTNIPSELYINSDGVLSKSYDLWRGKSKHIYITSDEEIKEGDWFLTTKNTVCKCYKTDDKYVYSLEGGSSKNCKKIILTTDQDLIKDGVQAIDDEFLEWFVKNSSCEEVRVEQSEFYSKKDFIDDKTAITYSYKIIIPKEEPKKKHIVMIVGDKVNEEPKQETLEEVAEKYNSQFLNEEENKFSKEDFINGAKWQQERSYSEEEIMTILYCFHFDLVNSNFDTKEKWFEQFKKK